MDRKNFLRKAGWGVLTVVVGPRFSALSAPSVNEGGWSLNGDGYLSIDTPQFRIKLEKYSQTMVALSPKTVSDFDFLPSDRLSKRQGDGYYQMGDIILRLRSGHTGDWKEYSTASKRTPVKVLPAELPVLAAAELNPTLANDMPLMVRRYWEIKDNRFVLRFELENTQNQDVEIGALSLPMIFNNILTDRELDEAHQRCSFSDPCIGLDAGYVQVTRLSGEGPALLAIPQRNATLEAYKLLSDDKTKRGTTFEGFYEWVIHSKAYADNEWKDAEQWNPASSVIVKAGQSRIYSLAFILASQIREIEPTLIDNGRPVAIGIPGYVLPMDQEARLFLKYNEDIASFSVKPEGALSLIESSTTKNNWKQFEVKGMQWGRVRLTVRYKDNTIQTINYKVIKPQHRVLKDLGDFLIGHQWFNKVNDPFGRNPSAISYDYFEQKQVTEEVRAWIAGLSDEGGNGSWLALVMKQLIDPEKQEVDKIQEFVEQVLDGGIQYNKGDQQFGVRKSMFYYEPDKMPEDTYDPRIKFGGWESWSEKEARSVGRSFNYPPVVAAYWTLYRLARNYEGLVTLHTWQWYLERAGQTAIAMQRYAPYYARFGQMEGTVFVMVLQDLLREGFVELARQYEEVMKKRADHWRTMAYPFGSEMPWDSTGQEEVYAWCRYFNYEEKARVTIDAITGYMPTVAHWGYNGNARRYWDFIYAGKLQRLERQIHHYGSGLNAVPILTEYRNHPDDIHLLRMGYGGLMGAISNITKEGFGPCAFHSFPETLDIDGYSGDYGPNFLGHVINTGTYVIDHPEFGWLAFGGNLDVKKNNVELIPLDSSRARIYFAPKRFWLVLDAGKISRCYFNNSLNEITLTLDPRTAHLSKARLRIEQPGIKGKSVQFKPSMDYQMERGCYVIPLNREDTAVKLVRS